MFLVMCVYFEANAWKFVKILDYDGETYHSVSLVIALLVCTIDDRRNDWNCTVCFQVVVLLVLDAKQGPLSTTETLSEGTDSEHEVDIVEEGVFFPELEEEEDEYISEDEVAEDGPVVEIGVIVDFFSQKSILTRLVLSKEPPIHVDIPDKAVGSAEGHCSKVNPEHRGLIVL